MIFTTRDRLCLEMKPTHGERWQKGGMKGWWDRGEEGVSGRGRIGAMPGIDTADVSTDHLRLSGYVKHCIFFLSLPTKRLFTNTIPYNFQTYIDVSTYFSTDIISIYQDSSQFKKCFRRTTLSYMVNNRLRNYTDTIQ